MLLFATMSKLACYSQHLAKTTTVCKYSITWLYSTVYAKSCSLNKPINSLVHKMTKKTVKMDIAIVQSPELVPSYCLSWFTNPRTQIYSIHNHTHRKATYSNTRKVRTNKYLDFCIDNKTLNSQFKNFFSRSNIS